MDEEKNRTNKKPEEISPDSLNDIGNSTNDKLQDVAVYDNIAESLSEHKKIAKQSKKLGFFLKAAAFLSFGLAFFSGILRFCLSENSWAAEVFYRSITRYLQAAMAKLTSLLPFSLAETLIIMLPFAAVTLFGFAIYRSVKKDTYRLKRMVVCIFIVLCMLFSNYILNLSILYCRPSLSELYGLDDSDITADELCVSSYYSVYKLQKCIDSDTFKFDISGASVSPYGYKMLDKKIEEAFNRFSGKNEWVSPYGANSKIIALSGLMTYTHISGIHTQYTGEANINVNYPDHVVCATMAHEKAHQRGIAPENEANLVAFFVLAESGDPYLEYCGYMSIFSDLASDCYKAAPEFYVRNIAPLIPAEVKNDFDAYARFFEKYNESDVAQVVDSANNAYLQLNGEIHGVKSYHMTSAIAAKYIIERIEEEFYVE